MRTPCYQPGENATVGPHCFYAEARNQSCTVVMCHDEMVGGTLVYDVVLSNGRQIPVRETTLRKLFERGRWSDPECVWRPNLREHHKGKGNG